MIPKKIHYIWLGGNDKPKNFKEVRESWKKYAEDFGFEIKEWNDENFDEINPPQSFFNFYKNKKWAFASDVLRFFILKKYGGIYLDIDQKLLKKIDTLLNDDLIIAKYHGLEDYYGFGFLAASKDNMYIEKMCQFFIEDKDYSESKHLPIINPIASKILNNLLNTYNDSLNYKIYDQVYFYPENFYKHDFSLAFTEHLGNTSWIPKWKKFLYKIPFYLKLKSFLLFFTPKFFKDKLFKIKY